MLPATIACILANANRNREEHPEAWTIEDFLPSTGAVRAPSATGPSPEVLSTKLDAFAAMFARRTKEA